MIYFDILNYPVDRTFSLPSPVALCCLDTLFIDSRVPEAAMEIVDLERACDACGRQPVGGGAHCLKCCIYFCLTCTFDLVYFQEKLPLKCPMCGGKFC